MDEQALYCVRTFIREYAKEGSNYDYQLSVLSKSDNGKSLDYIIGVSTPNLGMYTASYIKKNKRWYVDVFEKVASCAVDVIGKQWYDIEFSKVRRL